MMAIDSTIIKRKSEHLLNEIEHLKEFKGITFEIFKDSWRDIRIVERSIQIIAQAVLDIAGHIIANKGWGTPTTYREIVMTLVRNEILEDSLGNRLADLIGMRNILVHAYLAIDVSILHAAITQVIQDGPVFVQQILSIIP